MLGIRAKSFVGTVSALNSQATASLSALQPLSKALQQSSGPQSTGPHLPRLHIRSVPTAVLSVAGGVDVTGGPLRQDFGGHLSASLSLPALLQWLSSQESLSASATHEGR